LPTRFRRTVPGSGPSLDMKTTAEGVETEGQVQTPKDESSTEA
jgi:EAL domain-containing protein (putative c-di-GMP-specific phosphodiesterase class I)